MNKKQLYAAPATEVLELHLEGVIAASVDPIAGSPNASITGPGDEVDF